MRLSIGIVHYRSEQFLEQFLKSLQQFPPSCSFEIIVVNNDKKTTLQQAFPSIKWLQQEKNIGFGAALNRAVKESKGEYIFLANCDLLAKSGSFDQLFSFLQSYPKAGIVGPKLVFENGQIQDSARQFPSFFELVGHRLGFRPKKYLLLDQDKKVPFQCDWLVGAALLMRKDFFEKLGGFDERFFLFFEDTDLCRRVKEAGYEVWYCPDSIFTHTEKRLSESDWPGGWMLKRAFWIHVWSAGKYFWKWSSVCHSD